ncbi:MAG: molybdopterin-guanine dinucleotide biosynthesis protein B [Bacillota bacterium]|nr:molybdopterin-guanine dinucleotide biosynthesis protein B [Bacillota bacterium]MDI7249030.1 molybdopterin-guanine dinucleotide biosynthesis protein B [Bacillota bacterium]
MPEAVPVFGVTGASGSGKTTVLEALVGVLRERGWRVAVLKHTPGGFSLDRPGKDSWRFTRAGADLVMLHSDRAMAVLGQTEVPLDPARTAAALAAFCRHLGVPPPDLLLVEGHHDLEVPSVHVDAPGLHRQPGPRCLGVVRRPEEADRLADLVEQTLGLARREGEPEP